MALTSAEIIKKFQRGNNDTGSSEVQIALLTNRINELTAHLKIHQKDRHSRHGLLQMVSGRRRLLKYLMRTDSQRYNSLIQELGIRG